MGGGTSPYHERIEYVWLILLVVRGCLGTPRVCLGVFIIF
jgi:hypothetical protein